MAKKKKEAAPEWPKKFMAKRPGYYDNVLRVEGEVFHVRAQADVSKIWMVEAEEDMEIVRPAKDSIPPGHIASPVSTVRKEIQRLEEAAADRAEEAEENAAVGSDSAEPEEVEEI